MSNMLQLTPKRLKIWQQNLNKSRIAQEDLINSEVYKNYDLLVLQEPYLDTYGNTKATKYWRVIYPTSQLTDKAIVQSIILVNSMLDTNHCTQMAISDSNNTIAI
jgi:dimeric dUTPase (all-alpha-NTP-PPase superfamily)